MIKRNRLYVLAAICLALLVIAGGGCNPSASETQETPSQTATQTPSVTATTAETTPSQNPSQSIIDITVPEAYDLIQLNADNPDFIIVDVRTPEEYDGGHLENAILVDYRAEDFNTEIAKLERTKKYLIYCRTANRSAGARDVMKGLGFTDINHMLGGITEWIAEGYPVVK